MTNPHIIRFHRLLPALPTLSVGHKQPAVIRSAPSIFIFDFSLAKTNPVCRWPQWLRKHSNFAPNKLLYSSLPRPLLFLFTSIGWLNSDTRKHEYTALPSGCTTIFYRFFPLWHLLQSPPIYITHHQSNFNSQFDKFQPFQQVSPIHPLFSDASKFNTFTPSFFTRPHPTCAIPYRTAVKKSSAR